MFKKPVDYRSEQKNTKASEGLNKAIKNGLVSENGKVTEIFTWKFILAIALLPIWLLWKLFEYIHLLTIAIFGGLFLYFGVMGLPKNSWTESALLLIVGLALVVAPILFALDKDK